MSILKIKNEQGQWVELPVIKGTDGKDGADGKSGVYIGTEAPTDEDMDVWIDSDGTADDIVTDVQVNNVSVVNNGVAKLHELRYIKDSSYGNYGIIEGNVNTNIANGMYSHAEGHSTKASSAGSHAEGILTVSSGGASHAEGMYTTANHRSQHVFGEYNIEDPSTSVKDKRGNYVEIVGNGDSDSPSNARTLDWSGNEKIAGSLTLGMDTQDEVTITATELKALKDDYSSALTALGVI